MIRATVSGLLFFPLAALGHHSIGATFDSETVIELEGEVTRVLWRNPHVRFTINARDETGQETVWEVESQSVSTLRRKNVTTVLVAVGDEIKVAGNPSRRPVNEMHASHMLLPSGQEVVLRGTGGPRWTDEALGTSDRRTPVREALPSRREASSGCGARFSLLQCFYLRLTRALTSTATL